MTKTKVQEDKKYTKRAILMNEKGVKKDILKALLKDNTRYSLSEVQELYNEFLKGGKK
ncbi:MAG: hypothetical protein IJX99_08585 [Clostridia bacterium]|nr:hypothetical protein [Clostridia bacterium]